MKIARKLPDKLSRLIGNQSELARKTGIPQTAISAMTRGARRPYADQLFMIARELDVPVEYLLDDAQDEPAGGSGLSADERWVLGGFRELQKTQALTAIEAVIRMTGPGIGVRKPPEQPPNSAQRKRG